MNDVCPTDQYSSDTEVSAFAHTEPDAFKVKISQRQNIYKSFAHTEHIKI